MTDVKVAGFYLECDVCHQTIDSLTRVADGFFAEGGVTVIHEAATVTDAEPTGEMVTRIVLHAKGCTA